MSLLLLFRPTEGVEVLDPRLLIFPAASAATLTTSGLAPVALTMVAAVRATLTMPAASPASQTFPAKTRSSLDFPEHPLP